LEEACDEDVIDDEDAAACDDEEISESWEDEKSMEDELISDSWGDRISSDVDVPSQAMMSMVAEAVKIARVFWTLNMS
jgi:hypothetical protein